MKLITVLLALIAGMVLSGCVTPSPVPPTPSGQVIPIPIPGSYIQDNAISTSKILNSSISNIKLAANSTVFNFTYNNTPGNVTGLNFLPIGINASVTVLQNSSLSIAYTGVTNYSLYNNSYLQANVSTSTGSWAGAIPGALKVAGGVGANWNTTSIQWYNASVIAGTYNISIEGNSSDVWGVLQSRNNSLMVVAYPK